MISIGAVNAIQFYRIAICAVMFCAVLTADWSVADITMSRIFADNMVLQHSSTVNVTGTSEPDDQMIVAFNGQVVTTSADSNGNWSAQIQTPGPGGPYQMEVSVEGGDPKIVISDILVGEVWICAGQNNMSWPVGKAQDAETELVEAPKLTKIKLFTVEDNQSAEPLTEFDKVALWESCSQDRVATFSAVGFYFGREISRKFDVPVGLIDISRDFTVIEAWTPESAMQDVEQLQPLLNHWAENTDNLNNVDRPSELFNGMVSPLQGFPIRGVIWYQGEANVGRGAQYNHLMPALITGWRSELADGEKFPFYFVQPAPYRYEGFTPEALPELREAQANALDVFDQTGMVVTTDLGDPADINPLNKQEVGRRLALHAFATPYNEMLPEEQRTVVASGPTFERMETGGGRATLYFQNIGDGLVARTSAELTGFQICGEDREFKPATAVIEGEVVIVTSPDVEKVEAVRFAWNDTASPNFFNVNGLPAVPFRTDRYELQSVGVEF
ncbi:MAG: sialate O-acetylesterase [Planctomycetota bacterium]